MYEIPKPLGQDYEKARRTKDRDARSRAKREGKPAPRRPEKEPRFIAVYNPLRARRQKGERREKLREKLGVLRTLPAEIKQGRKVLHGEEKLAAVQKRVGRQGKYFQLTLDEGDRIGFRLNRETLREVRRQEGLQLLATDLAQHYRMLIEIENAFKELKGFLRLRPVRHWSEDRVRGHAAVCVLGYLLEHWLEKRKLATSPAPQVRNMTAQKALKVLSDLSTVRLEFQGESLLRPTRISPEQRPILKLFGLTKLPALLPEVP